LRDWFGLRRREWLRELAAAGKDIVVLEAGNYYDDADFDGAELAGFQRCM